MMVFDVLGLFEKGKTHLMAEFDKTELHIQHRIKWLEKNYLFEKFWLCLKKNSF